MALEMKNHCERCNAALPAQSEAARICSYECTFCADCSTAMQDRCPNCAGELLARPRRKK
jgi:hypothetical protein